MAGQRIDIKLRIMLHAIFNDDRSIQQDTAKGHIPCNQRQNYLTVFCLGVVDWLKHEASTDCERGHSNNSSTASLPCWCIFLYNTV